MEGLSIEQKAKAYDKALERAKQLYVDGMPQISRNTTAYIFPELKESEDEKIRKFLIEDIKDTLSSEDFRHYNTEHTKKLEEALAWLEKQGEQKPTQETEPFEAEHGKYYYCIKDYFCGGRKQATKGDVIQALRGLPIMGLKDASEYFLPVNFIKCNSAWSEEDKDFMYDTLSNLTELKDRYGEGYGNVGKCIDWLKSLKKE